MPEVPRRTHTFEAPAAAVDAAVAAARAAGAISYAVAVGTDGSTVTFAAEPIGSIPYFGFILAPLLLAQARREMNHAADAVEAIVAGKPIPAPRRTLPFSPPTRFDDRQTALLAAVAAVLALAELGGSLFSQFVDFVGVSFSASDRALGAAAAVSRSGVLIALVASAMADRQGRRRLLLWSLGGLCLGNAISAMAPTLAVFTVGQILVRGFVNSTIAIAVIAAVEAAPEGARAYSIAMLTLAGGAGYAVGVALLPLADVARHAWRIAFVISALCALALPSLARQLRETERFETLAARTPSASRGRVSEVFDDIYGRRFLLLALFGFLLNIFAAPSSQLQNRFLGRDRHFSGAGIASLTAVTTGVPGFVGLALGGRLAETHGRRKVGAIGLVLASLAAIAFYLSRGATLWLTSAANGFLGGAAAPALGAFNSELFPTEVRGTANGMLTVVTLLGSVVGLLAAGVLSSHIGLGNALAWLGLAPLIGALVLALLPEPADKLLDDVSPSEV
jgi:MFS family permease